MCVVYVNDCVACMCVWYMFVFIVLPLSPSMMSASSNFTSRFISAHINASMNSLPIQATVQCSHVQPCCLGDDYERPIMS